MFEDRFVQMLQKYPEAVSEKKKFVGLMKDFFPEQQKQVNLICTAFDLGIAEELNKTNQISNTFAFRFVKRMLDEYGVSRVNADWVISAWCVCYGKLTLHKPCDIEISKAKQGSAPAIRDVKSPSGKQYNDLFQYQSVSNGYGISGFNGDNMRTLILPNAYNGKPVTRIMAGVFEDCDVQEVVMTDGIAVIEESAFKNCRSLKQVIFPGTLREIGDTAFAGCISLVTAALPKSLEKIGSYAFAETALKQVDFPANLLLLGDGVYMDCMKLSSVHLPKNTSELPNKLFKGCTALKKMELPEGLLSIGNEAFSGCSTLIDLIVPGSVVQVGESAFAGMDPSFRLICTQKSATEHYARNHNVPFQIVL